VIDGALLFDGLAGDEDIVEIGDGATLSCVNDTLVGEHAEMFPAASVAVARNAVVEFAVTLVAIENAPPAAVPVPAIAPVQSVVV
jgi:hypothetical protein